MPQTLQELLEQRLGAETFARISDAGFTVGTTAARLIPQDPNRVGFWIVNLSLNNVFIGPFVTPSITRGVLVGPNGGNVIVTFQEDLSVTGWEWSAIADGAASAVLTVEYLIKKARAEDRRAG
jgi:hypothetical protein